MEPQHFPGAIPLESENYPGLLHTFVEQICITLNNLWPLLMSIIENLLSYFSKLNLYKSYQPLSINEVVLRVTAHVLLVYCPQASDYMLSRPPVSLSYLVIFGNPQELSHSLPEKFLLLMSPRPV